MGERAMNYLALRSSAITRITTAVLKRLVDDSELNRSNAEGRVFVFETNIAPMYARKGPGSTFDLEWELDLQRYLSTLGEHEFRLVRVSQGGEAVDYRGDWTDHPFASLEPVASIQADFDTFMQRSTGTTAHPACKPDVHVNSGAWTLALNVLRHAGKEEVAVELEATAQREPATQQELIEEIGRLVQVARTRAIEPFSVKVGEKLDVEIWPLALDDRVIVGREVWSSIPSPKVQSIRLKAMPSAATTFASRRSNQPTGKSRRPQGHRRVSLGSAFFLGSHFHRRPMGICESHFEERA